MFSFKGNSGCKLFSIRTLDVSFFVRCSSRHLHSFLAAMFYDEPLLHCFVTVLKIVKQDFFLKNVGTFKTCLLGLKTFPFGEHNRVIYILN